MYIPRSFAEEDRATLHAFMRQHAFAALVTVENGVPVANHVPFLVDAERGPAGTLVGHLARANPQWRGFAGEAMAVFQGPHGYVSPRWYAGAPNVPTWNYAVVHAYGTPRVIDDAAAVLAVVRRLTEVYERENPRPWSVDEVPAEFVDRLLRAIVAFELPISRLEGKFKLNQNKTAADRAGVIAALAGVNEPLAELMRRVPAED